jgi:hypothetical protein
VDVVAVGSTGFVCNTHDTLVVGYRGRFLNVVPRCELWPPRGEDCPQGWRLPPGVKIAPRGEDPLLPLPFSPNKLHLQHPWRACCGFLNIVPRGELWPPGVKVAPRDEVWPRGWRLPKGLRLTPRVNFAPRVKNGLQGWRLPPGVNFVPRGWSSPLGSELFHQGWRPSVTPSILPNSRVCSPLGVP